MKKIFIVLFVVLACFGNAKAQPGRNVFNDSILAYRTYLLEMIPLSSQTTNDGIALPAGGFAIPALLGN